MLPYAIVVINAAANGTDERLLDPVAATHVLLDDLKDAVNKNAVFHEWATYWREKEKPIESTKDLLLSFYTDIKIVFISDKSHPKLVWDQYQRLSAEITSAVDMSRRRRHNVRLLLNSDKFNPYLQFAFSQFSESLDAPFDFVRVSALFNQLQPQFDPVLSLIKGYRARWPESDVMEIFVQVHALVASAILLDVARKDLQGLSSSRAQLIPCEVLRSNDTRAFSEASAKLTNFVQALLKTFTRSTKNALDQLLRLFLMKNGLAKPGILELVPGVLL